ncbi:MAG: SurA N-terminal domain-containing protein [Alphaproteobacteria bacterium]|nr:SurA N-terminal domain-containing protein [Alphaproteobacteria bacterium]
MLLQFRNITKGWIATIIVGLVGLATVLFLIPNSGLDLGGDNSLANVGGRSITKPQLDREIELTLRGERENGNNLSREDAIDQGIHRSLLERMINRVAMYVYADKIGVSASDTQVRTRIADIPAVHNAVTGAFDQNAYTGFLTQMRYTQTEFERDVRGDLTTAMVVQSLMAGVRAPSSFGALTYAYDAETRVVSLIEAPATAVGAIPQPNEAQVQAFYEDSQQQLRLPEFRVLTIVYARPSDFSARVQIPEERIRAEFDAGAAQMTRPETRTYVRIAATNEAQANEAAQRINRGEAPAAVAQAMSLQVTRGENQSRAQVPDEAAATAVFGAQVRGPAVVARSTLSPFIVVRVEGSTPAVAPSYAEHREEIRAALAGEQAQDLMATAVSAFEDARSAGGTLAEAARQSGLTTVTLPAIEAQGRNQQGEPVEAAADLTDVLATAFATPEGEATDFQTVGDADVMAGVDRIIPESVRPLEEVRTELVQAWIRRERGNRLRELAETMTTALTNGQSLTAVANANHARVVATSRTVDRRAARQNLPQGMAEQLFAVGERTPVHIVGDAGILIGVVEHINRPDITAIDPQILEATRTYAERPCLPQALQAGAPPVCGLSSSVVEALQSEIVADANPRRNDRIIEREYRSSTTPDEATQQ